jgi:hypothetical protein
MLNAEQEPKKKKKKGLLSEKMGLDQGSEMFAPPRPQPEVSPGSAEEELNKRSREGVVNKVHNKLNDRKGAPRAR